MDPRAGQDVLNKRCLLHPPGFEPRTVKPYPITILTKSDKLMRCDSSTFFLSHLISISVPVLTHEVVVKVICTKLGFYKA